MIPSILLKLFPVMKDYFLLLPPTLTQNTLVFSALEMQEDIYQEENFKKHSHVQLHQKE